MHLAAPVALFTERGDRSLPTLKYNSTRKKSCPFIYMKLEKRYLFWVEPTRIGHYREYPSPRA